MPSLKRLDLSALQKRKNRLDGERSLQILSYIPRKAVVDFFLLSLFLNNESICRTKILAWWKIVCVRLVIWIVKPRDEAKELYK